MGRPKRQTVDYFPHYVNHGKTMFILEQRYGNDGYAFWFKLLEVLGSTEGHCYDVSNLACQEFLAAKTRLTWETCENILDLLAILEAIDPELWSEKLIWSNNLVSNLDAAYRNRLIEKPLKPDILRKKPRIAEQTDVRNTQMKVNEMKVNEKKTSVCISENDAPENILPPLPLSPPKGGNGRAKKEYDKDFETFFASYPRRQNKMQAFKAWQKNKPRLPPLDDLISIVKTQNAWKQWQEGFIPHAATWLNNSRWEDEPPSSDTQEDGISQWLKKSSQNLQ